MRIAVIGAGAVGGTIAALLSRAEHEVELTARGAHLEAIRERGIRLSGAWGEHTARVDAVADLRRAPELAFVTTKAQDADAAMRSAAHLLGGIPVVIVQNGLDSVTSGHAALPDSHVIGALALFAASYLSPGDVAVTAPGRTYLGGTNAGSDDSGTDAPLLVVERVLGKVLPVTVTPNFVGAQWTKLVINQVNALPAITGLSAQAVIADRQLRRIMTASMREAVAAGRLSGVRFAALQGLSNAVLRLFQLAPFEVAQLLPLAMARRMGATPNPGSTLQSIRRGQLTEIDHLNGAVVATAESVGVAAPVNEALVELVHEVERNGHFFSSDDVTRRLAAGHR